MIKFTLRLLCLVWLAAAVPGPPAQAAHSTGGVPLTPDLKSLLLALPLIDGARLTRAALDESVVVVSFFASWCPPCRVEFEHLKRIDAAYGGNGVTVVVLNVFEDYGSYGDGGGRLIRFLAGQGARFPVLRGNPAIRAAFGDVTRIPTLYVFDHAGHPAKTNLSLSELDAAVRGLLTASRRF